MSVFPTPVVFSLFHHGVVGVTLAEPEALAVGHTVIADEVPTGLAGGCGGDALQYIHEMR
jgi:hypothetical protein